MEGAVFRLQAWFVGHVQGVGFRYQTVQLAHGFSVTGMVQNLADGRVYLEAEGAEVEVQAFFEAVQTNLKGFIREVQTRTALGSRHHTGFTISRVIISDTGL